ncbi:MAG: hypothetical protein WC521_05145 [Bdellovibrionales bacterium]|jgi:hypothetical protein
MPISQTSFLSEILDEKAEIPEGKLAYFRERLRHRLYDFIVSGFLEKERNNRLTRSDLARRIHKSREQITRWLASPGNWEIDTISDLTLAIFCGELKELSAPLFSDIKMRNSDQLSCLETCSGTKTFSFAPISAKEPISATISSSTGRIRFQQQARSEAHA